MSPYPLPLSAALASSSAAGPFTILDTVPASANPSYTDGRSFMRGERVYYQVTAVLGSNLQTSPASAEITPVPTPASDIGFAQPNGTGQIDIFWPTSPDADLQGYLISVKQGANSDFVPLNNGQLLPPTVNGTSDSGYQDTESATDLFYQIIAVDGWGSESTPVVAQFAPGPLVYTPTGTVSGNGTQIDLADTAVEAGATLSYDWQVVGTPPGAVTFDDNNNTTNGSACVATLTTAGNYTFQVTVSDGLGNALSQQVTVPIEQIVSTLAIEPAATSASPLHIAPGQTQKFTATATDQFGNAMALPSTVSWSLVDASSSDSSIDVTSGLFTAGGDVGELLVQASDSVSGASAQVPVEVAQPAPTIVDAASATLNSVGTTAALSVLGDSAAGESTLTYTWATLGTPPAAVQYSDNGDNSAKDTTATFTAAGTYQFEVTVTDGAGSSSTSDVTLDIGQTATTIAVTPGTALVPVSTATQPSTQQFSGQVLDQFGNAMPGTVAWSDSSGSPIDSTGLYTAPASGNTDTVTAICGTATGNAAVGLLGSADSAVAATAESSSDITLSWAAVPNAICYDVYRSTQPNFDPTKQDLVDGSDAATSFNDFTVGTGANYYYQVYATTSSTSGQGDGLLGAAVQAPDEPTPPDTPLQFTGLQAVGVNDLEILLHWSTNIGVSNDPNTSIIQESTDGVHWSDVGWAPVGETYYLVRGCGSDGSQFLQEDTSYYFQVSQTNTVTHATVTSDPSNAADVMPPADYPDLGRDMVVVCAPLNWSLSKLLRGVSLNTTGSGPVLTGQSAMFNSVGSIWVDLVNQGYDAYLAPDPADGDNFSGTLPDGDTVPNVINPDGSGRLATEIQYEAGIDGFFDDRLDLGLVGWSWGGGMTSVLESYLASSGNTPDNLNITYAATIDAMVYNQTDVPLPSSPAMDWGGSPSYGFNIYETNGLGVTEPPFIHVALFIKDPNMHGVSMPAPVVNVLDNADYHNTIGIDQGVLDQVESNLFSVYDMLSGY
jgi:hypothetical protein